MRRIFLSAAALLLLGVFSALLAFYLWPYPKLRVIALSVGDYDGLQAPPLLFATEAVERLTALSSERADTDRSQGTGNLTVDSLRTSIREQLPTVRSSDCLVMFVAAHGIQAPETGGAETSAAPYLLCAEYQAATRRGVFRVDDVLDSLERQPARLKLLALDCGGMQSDPREGVLVNEFARVLGEALQKRKDPRLWVLLSNGMFERSHVSSASKSTAFSHYLTQGLAGAADGATARAPNREIELDELTHYVQKNVGRWVWEVSRKTQSQAPVLLHAREGIIADWRNVPATFVALAPKSDTKPQHAALPKPTHIAGFGVFNLPSLFAFQAPTPEPAKTPEAPPAPATKAPESAQPSPAVEIKPVRKSVLEQITEAAAVVARRASSGSWTPVDYAPSLWRAYLDLLAAYRERSAGGVHFTSGAGAQELEDQIRALDQIEQARRLSLEQFDRGPARESYDAFPSIAAAVRLRDDVLFRCPDVIYGSPNGWLGDGREPRAAGEDCRHFAEALAQLQRLVATLEDAPENLGQDSDSKAGQWGKQIDASRRELERLIKPSDLRIDPTSVATPAMWSAKLEVMGDEVLPQNLASAQSQAIIARVNCELALVQMVDREKQEGYKQLQSALEVLESTSSDDMAPFCEAARVCGAALRAFYQDLPNRVSELRRDNATKSWRAAETAMRMLLARDAQRVNELLRQPTSSGRRNPMTDVPMLAAATRIELAGPDNARSGGPQGPVALGLDASTYSWELRSTRSLGDGVQYTVDYDTALLDVKDRTKQTVVPRTPRQLAVGAGARSTTISLLIAGRGESQGPVALTLEATMGGVKSRSVTQFALPEQTHLELAVVGGEGTWQRLSPTATVADRYLLRPFVLGAGRSTDYSLQIKDSSGRGTAIGYQLLAISREELATGLPAIGQLLDPRVKPSSAWTAIAKVPEMTVPAGGTPASLAAAAPKADAAGTTPVTAATPQAIRDAGALVFVAEYAQADGKAKRYVSWLELQCRHPETYLQDPDVNFNDRDSMIHAVERSKDGQVLPLGGARVAIESPDKRVQLVRPKLNVQQGGDSVELLASVPRDPQATVTLWVSADAWPRAFIYKDVHCWLSQKADRTSLQLNEIANVTAVGRAGDKPVPPLSYGGRGGDDQGWLFPRLERLALAAQIDMPPDSAGEEYRCRFSIARQGSGPEGSRLLTEFRSDRARRVNLLPTASPGSLQLEAEATDLSLDIDPQDYANTPSRLDVEIMALTSERSPERRRVVSRNLLIDTQPPEVRLQDQNRQTLEAVQDQPLAVMLTAVDRANGGVARVELSFQRENNALVNPVQAFAIREGSDTYQATVPTKDRPPGAHHELWYQAIDRVGNVSLPASVSVFIKPPKPVNPNAATTNSIRGVVRRGGRGMAGIKVDLSGQAAQSTTSAADGSFTFTGLKPGAYSLSARGFIAGTAFKANDTPATVAAPPAEPAFVALELQ